MLAILTTHAIQYQVPIWKALAARGKTPFKVLYMSDLGLKERFDPGFGRALAWDIDLLGGYEHEWVPVHKGKRPDAFWSLRLNRGFVSTLQNMGVRVLWAQGWQVAAYWQAVAAARRAGVEVWMRGDTNISSNAGGVRQDIKRFVLRRLFNRVDRFLCVGEANRQFYLRQGIGEERLASAPHCVDNGRFAAQADGLRAGRAALRERWGIPANAFCVLFSGKLVEKKRPLDLIEAVKRLNGAAAGKPLHILIAGTGELEAAARNAAKGMGASFAGFLNQSEIVKAYVAADCLALPSNAQETWGLVVNEAMASGLPCVVSNACGCSGDLVQPLRPDLCYPMGDTTALAHAIANAAANPPDAPALRNHIARYDYMRTVETVEALYALTAQERRAQDA
jgi:glycosyltransferase involved in cell wall biosynthesis